MHRVLELPSWMDAQYWLDMFGPWALWGALAIIFAECGLLLGFFLPGDSLLFTVGLLTGTPEKMPQPLWLACLLLTVAAFLGNVSGYEIGRRTGPAIFSREDSRLFKREHVDKTVMFFERHGPRAIVLARFVPIVRTFITVTAGVGRMDRRTYLVYSGIGGAVWATGVTILGSLLGRFEFVKKNIELMLLLVVALSVLPVVVEFLRERARRRREGEGEAGPDAAGGGTGPGDRPGTHQGGARPDEAYPGAGTHPGGYPASPYQADPYQADPYQADPYQAAGYPAGGGHQAGGHQADPYQADPYQAGGYAADPYQTNPYPTHPYQAGAYPTAADHQPETFAANRFQPADRDASPQPDGFAPQPDGFAPQPGSYPRPGEFPQVNGYHHAGGYQPSDPAPAPAPAPDEDAGRGRWHAGP